MIKFEKIQAGMALYDRHRQRMGNTTITTIGEWCIKVISVDPVTRSAKVSWNSNPERVYYERQLSKLSPWSMYDPDVERTEGMFGRVSKVRKLSKKEFETKKAAKGSTP